MTENQPLTHGSLFAGIGGFEIAAKECGIKTLWNCEIDPYCRLVLKARFPDAVQYGDIKTLDGGKIQPVFIISMGSPCQSFSVASATRTGLDGVSGMFLEAVRVIREMLEASNNQFPRIIIMENVPGIFSSKSVHSGQKSDFGVVLNEFVKICGETVAVPEPPKGKWLHAGSVLGDTYSIAYRCICASKFGLAQRRTRMYLVCCPSDLRAAQVLSECEGERRNFTPGYFTGKKASPSIKLCPD